MFKEHKQHIEQGDDSYVFWGRGRKSSQDNECKFACELGCKVHALLDRATGRHGFYSSFATRRLLNELDRIQPDVVHLHNIHGYYVNVKMLFEWLKKSDCMVEWTLHDCWSFTGHCSHFTYVGCNQWHSHCAVSERCPQLLAYPKTFASSISCKKNFEAKRKLFTALPSDRMTIITPSRWLADLVQQSYLSKYPIKVRYNTIDNSIFKPTPSNFREKFGIGNRFMVLGVAYPWNDRKGLADFIKLAHELDSDRFVVVLVGLNERQIAKCRDELVALPRTENRTDLAKVYSAANVFVHPGIEETFGLTVAEAQACGTPVIVTEGSACAEIAASESSMEISPDLSNLRPTILKLAGGGCVILLQRTSSAKELAVLYSSADVFFNPTVEDNYPTVNLEAESCKTPVITYDTGGCAETIHLINSRCVKSYDAALIEINKMSDLVIH